MLETVAGAVRLAQSEATAFADLRSRVTSKNGTTEAALLVLTEWYPSGEPVLTPDEIKLL